MNTANQNNTDGIRTARCMIGWLIDGTGGPIRKDVCLEVAEGRITRIRDIDPADGTQPEAIDMTAHTVLPRLVDAHVHLFMSGTSNPEVRDRQLEADYPEARAQIVSHLHAHRECGIMAVRDGGDRLGHGYRFQTETSGLGPVGVLVRSPGRAWHRAGRYGRLIARALPDRMTLAQAIRSETDAVDHVKIVNSGLNSLVDFGKITRPQFGRDEMREATAAATERRLPVMVHANGSTPVAIAAIAGCTSIEHGFFMGAENLARMAELGTCWVPTAITMKAYAATLPPGSREADGALRNLEHQLGQIAEARRLGVWVAAGSDAGSLGVHHGLGLVQEMALLNEAGYSIGEAVACASASGARLLGLSQRGRLVRGAPAEFLVVDGPPETVFDRLPEPAAVWVDGSEVEMV